MRTCVSSTYSKRPPFGVAALSALAILATCGTALADAKVRSVTPAQVATQRADVEKQVAAAEVKPKDPLTNLSVSDKAKALQERADQILAENGESRIDDDEEAEAAFATNVVEKPKDTGPAKPQAAKAKTPAPTIQCVAGCE